MIAIIDYGVNNLASVRNACVATGASVVVTSDADTILEADAVVLPGIGAASAGMMQLRARGLDGVVRQVAHSGTPLLAICLGMQLLFERSEEGGNVPCLNILPGTVKLLTHAEKVPQIGWNQVAPMNDAPLWRHMSPDPYFYFVHSYICVPDADEVVAGITDYGGGFCSAVAYGSVWGTQFHPERSGTVGLRLIKNFITEAEKLSGGRRSHV